MTDILQNWLLPLGPLGVPLLGAVTVLILHRFRMGGSLAVSLAVWTLTALLLRISETEWPPEFITTGVTSDSALARSLVAHFTLTLERIHLLQIMAGLGMTFSLLAHYHGREKGPVSVDLAAIQVLGAATGLLLTASSLGAIAAGVLLFGTAVPLAIPGRTPRWSSPVLRHVLAFGFGFFLVVTGAVFVMLSVPSMDLGLIQDAVHAGTVPGIGFVLLMVGCCLSLGWAPLNVFFPSIVGSIPTMTAAYLDTFGKLALLFVAVGLFPFLEKLRWSGVPLGDFLGCVFMAWGALGAIGETRLSKLLYHTGLVHGGFLLFTFEHSTFVPAISLFVLTYVGLYSLLCFLEQTHAAPDIHHLSGLGLHLPFLGLGVTVLLLALATLPPSALYLTRWTGGMKVGHGSVASLLVLGPWLAVILSAMRVLFLMYARPPHGGLRYEGEKAGYFLLLTVAALGVVGATVFPFGPSGAGP